MRFEHCILNRKCVSWDFENPENHDIDDIFIANRRLDYFLPFRLKYLSRDVSSVPAHMMMLPIQDVCKTAQDTVF